MSDFFKLGAVVRSKLSSKDMTIYNEGPVELGGVPAFAYGVATTKPNMSHDYVRCVWFEGKQVKRDKFNKNALDWLRLGEGHGVSVGDIVKLSSGGPKMEVTRVGPMDSGPPALGVASGVRNIQSAAIKEMAVCRLDGISKLEKFEVALLERIS
ncbi:DUF2158 domain-containing protein [Pseudomonas marginalis]|uniref:DUF2158 domain-containing protein n=1 Tax=Pseudomonas marginalis TaxID=298 RepID=UPI002A35D492|nr:DUF2158 domain-containing protein [Pseudomonas marginalis]WPN21828.1 DUF2158 domain-containing protein [Pseudomonas marginalis]